MAQSQSPILSPSRALFLAHANLTQIFSNPNIPSRLAAMQECYHPNITLYEPGNAPLTSHAQISETVTQLLAENGGVGV